MYEKIGSMNYLELLGVSDDAGIKTITKRYFELTKEFHPDKSYNYSDPSLKEKLTSIVNTITTAYNTLKDPALRNRYTASISGKKILEPEPLPSTSMTPEKAKQEPKMLPSSPELQMALNMIKNRNFSEAIQLLNEIIKKDPTDPQAKNYLALAYLKKGDYKLAETIMLEAVRLKPTSEYYTNLGLIYIKLKDFKNAYEVFHKALEINPSSERVRQYLEKIRKSH